MGIIFDWLAAAWIIPSDAIPDRVDVIISTSQGMKGGELVRQNWEHLDRTLKISEEHPEALVGYSAFAGSADPEAELAIKSRVLLGRMSVSVGPVSNTATEAAAYHQVLLQTLGREPRTVVLVTSELHGRGVRFAYRREFPCSRIVLVFTPWQSEIDPNDLHLLSRNKWLWLLSHMVRQVMFILPGGYEVFKKSNLIQPGREN